MPYPNNTICNNNLLKKNLKELAKEGFNKVHLSHSPMSFRNMLARDVKNVVYNSIANGTNFPDIGFGYGVNNGVGGGPFNYQVSLKITITFGLKSRPKVSGSISAGVNANMRRGNIRGNAFAGIEGRFGGLGTSSSSKFPFSFDIYVGAELEIGYGLHNPIASYSLTPTVPTDYSNFKAGLKYGNAFSWHYNPKESRSFSLSDIQRHGIVGLKIFDFALSSHNDTRRAPYFGGGTDYYWTGGITLNHPWFRFSHETFTGKYNENASIERKREELISEIKNIKKDKDLLIKEYKKYKEKERKTNLMMELANNENKINAKKLDLKQLIDNNYHTQSPYQKSLNQSSTELRIFTLDGDSFGVGYSGPMFLQNGIHKLIKDLRFEYMNTPSIKLSYGRFPPR